MCFCSFKSDLAADLLLAKKKLLSKKLKPQFLFFNSLVVHSTLTDVILDSKSSNDNFLKLSKQKTIKVKKLSPFCNI